MGDVRGFSRHIKWTPAEVDILTRHYADTPHPQLAQLLPGRSLRKIQCKANELGLARTKKPARTVDEIRTAKRGHMARLRAADPAVAREKQRLWRLKNHEREKAKERAYYGRRFFWGRAMKLRGENRAWAIDLWRVWKRQRGLCALTGRRLDRTAQLDHITAKARGGGDNVSNLRWVCAEINILKRHLTDEELMALCADVLRWAKKPSSGA